MADADLTPPPSDSWTGSPIDDPLLGLQLGNFRIVDRIAEGGMGVIYRAVHTVIGRQAAIKILTQKYSSDRNMIKRLHREAQAVNRIGHPNIVDVFDFGQTPDGREYFVMEYLAGPSLAKLLDRTPRLPWTAASQIMRQMLDALAAAHQCGIVHRDIKPENIVVVPQADGSLLVKILDFGIAKSVGLGPIGEQLTRAGSVMGTPEYIAPEQIRGKQIDGRADLYSAGVILFEMLMGRRPFTSDKVITLLMAHLREPVPPMTDIPAELGVPSFISDVVHRAMAKDPDQRFGDAHAFARALGFELSQVTAMAGTRPLTRASCDELSLAEAGPALRSGPQATMPGAGAMPTVLSEPEPRRSSWRYAPPVVILVLALGLVSAKLLFRSDPTVSASPPGDATLPGPAAAAPRQIDTAKFEPVRDLPALLTRVRRMLRRNLQAGDAGIRRIAARATGKLRDTDAHALLVSVLKEDPEPTVRSAAALALVEVGDAEAAATLRRVRAHNCELTRVAIDEALMRLGQQDGRSELLAALRSRDKAVRGSAALALGSAGDRRALPALVEVISQVSAVEQPAVVAAMGMAARLGHERATASLKEGLQRDDRPLVQIGCAEALAQLGNDTALQFLRRVVEDPSGPGGSTRAANRAVSSDDGDQQTVLVAARILASFGDYVGLDVLGQAIRAKDDKTRALAASGLGAVADKSALAPLAAALDDEILGVRMAAAEAMATILALMPNQLVRRSQSWVFAALERGDWALRFAAVGVTSEMDPELAVELLGWALRDTDAGIRAAAVTRIGQLRTKTPRAIRILTVALTDESPEVRASAASALNDVPATEATQARKALAVAVRDRDTRVGIIAAGQLLAMGDTRHLGDLRQAARLRDPQLRSRAIEALGHWQSPRATPLLVAALKDRSPAVRLAAALQLARRDSRAGLAVLEKAAREGGATGHAALRAMARLGISPAERLETLARSSDPASRKAAIEVVDLLEPAVAVRVLRGAAADPEVEVRRAAARGLARMAGEQPQIVPVLRQLSRDPDPAVRAAAAMGLARVQTAGADLDPGGVAAVTPAPLPENRLAPTRPPQRDASRPLFVDDTARVNLYKFHISRAEALKRRGQFQAALTQLRLARRSMDKAPVLFDSGLVHLKLAQKHRRNSKAAANHLRRARIYFQQYLRRAPQGKLADQARGGLRDVARMSQILR